MITALLLGVALATSSRATQSEDEQNIRDFLKGFYDGINSGEMYEHWSDFYTADAVVSVNGHEVGGLRKC